MHNRGLSNVVEETQRSVHQIAVPDEAVPELFQCFKSVAVLIGAVAELIGTLLSF